ncbi:GntR family transcriptional regulator [Amycolatopsis roodepoortensis]|uniref:GntR family transcriptional regulator n=1 Tax=Amycolatopsis roodepoortensis TaxID=700274 RepID=UPI000F895216|nr:GntR family transcriptional regulator [Amycolatopsis roodepoortensis]RSN22117.1 GntR family transcriptional regulator [Streptomyces sp. WAC 05977]UUV36098.1 GntR family transcriptional regulator [Amycolatopsis roodepoortensis]
MTAGDAVNGTAKSKSQIAYHWIKARIDDGTFSPGYRLVFGQIAQELGVSTVPVREAVRRLEAEGLVTYEHNIGAQVAMADESDYQHTMQTLALVEGYAAALAAPSLPGEALDEAKGLNAELTACLDNFEPSRFTALNRDFHRVLFGTCPNPQVLDLVNRGWNRLAGLRTSTFSFVPGRAHESVREHQKILDLFDRNAPAGEIELAVREHRLTTLETFLAWRHP